MYTFLLYIFYNAYLEILKLKVYFENFAKNKWEKHLKTKGVVGIFFVAIVLFNN